MTALVGRSEPAAPPGGSAAKAKTSIAPLSPSSNDEKRRPAIVMVPLGAPATNSVGTAKGREYVSVASATHAGFGPASRWVVVPAGTDRAAPRKTLPARPQDPASTRYIPRGNAENIRSIETAPPLTAATPEDGVGMRIRIVPDDRIPGDPYPIADQSSASLGRVIDVCDEADVFPMSAVAFPAATFHKEVERRTGSAKVTVCAPPDGQNPTGQVTDAPLAVPVPELGESLYPETLPMENGYEPLASVNRIEEPLEELVDPARATDPVVPLADPVSENVTEYSPGVGPGLPPPPLRWNPGITFANPGPRTTAPTITTAATPA